MSLTVLRTGQTIYAATHLPLVSPQLNTGCQNRTNVARTAFVMCWNGQTTMRWAAQIPREAIRSFSRSLPAPSGQLAQLWSRSLRTRAAALQRKGLYLNTKVAIKQPHQSVVYTKHTSISGRRPWRFDRSKALLKPSGAEQSQLSKYWRDFTAARAAS